MRLLLVTADIQAGLSGLSGSPCRLVRSRICLAFHDVTYRRSSQADPIPATPWPLACTVMDLRTPR